MWYSLTGKMKNLFKKTACKSCGKTYDPTCGSCPQCGEKGPYFDESKQFVNHVHCGWVRNLLLFLIGFIGFQVAGVVAYLAAEIIITAQNRGASVEDITKLVSDFSNSAGGNLIVNFVAYAITITALLSILGPYLKQVGAFFKKGKSYGYGILFAAVLLAFSFLWGIISYYIDPHSTSNANQQLIDSMVGGFPLASLILFGILGPISEEIAYRLGLFSLLKRWNKVGAYIIAPLIFGLIHFGWTSIGTTSFFNELLNIPDYIFAGVVLCYVYDKYGVGASTIAHIGNNVTGIVISIVRITLVK